MKIFNWFRNKDTKKPDNDKISLLETKAFEGILSIGTLGIDLIHDFKHENDTFIINDQVLFIGDDHEDDHEKEMESPLVLKACKHGFEFDHVKKQDLSPCDKVANPKNDRKDVGVKDSKDLVFKNGERTTLADLFWAESQNNLLKDNNQLFDDRNVGVMHADNNVGKPESIKSSLISKKEKLGKDDLSRKFKKTKQLMRKMLKKKIHPDIGIQKKETASTW